MTFFCTMISGLILAVMSCICLYISQSIMKNDADTSLVNSLDVVILYLENTSLIPHSWILQTESNYGLQMSLYNNGCELMFHTLESDPSRDALTNLASNTALETYSLNMDHPDRALSSTQIQRFPVTGSNNQIYDAAVIQIPKPSGFLSAVILHSRAALDAQIQRLERIFIAVDVSFFLLLGIFSWLFSRYTIRPLERNQEQQAQFIAAISTALGLPLTSMLSALPRLQSASLPEIPKIAQGIELEGDYMSRMINNMLFLVNADINELVIYPEPLELDTLLLEIGEKFELLARSREVNINYSFPDEALPLVTCDNERMNQALSILLDYSLRIAQTPGNLNISFDCSKEWVEIRIADSRTSILEQYEKIDVAQLCKSYSKNSGGVGWEMYSDYLGIGIPIVHKIMDLHGGTITLQNNAYGGYSFVITIPL